MSGNKNKGGGFFNNPTRRVGGGSAAANKPGAANAPTRAMIHADSSVQNNQSQASNTTVPDPVTRRVRPAGISGNGVPEAVAGTGKNCHPEYVVGWLVVVEGPGRGVSKPLGYGMNPLGRDEVAGVQLNYGDEEISRHGHCQIAYDHKNRKFYIQPGAGPNLTYLGDQPVLTAVEIFHNAVISVGNTTLKFVQLCGDGFDWE